MPIAFHLFETKFGLAGLAWTPGGVVRSQLPEETREATCRRLLKGLSDPTVTKPDGWVKTAVAGITRLLAGEPDDLTGIPLDLSGLGDFERRVYETCRTLGPGQTMTYGALAAKLGDPGLARAVGQAMGRNPFAPIVPCHRVVAADGRLGGFSAGEGRAFKARLLAQEGARGLPGPTLFDHFGI